MHHDLISVPLIQTFFLCVLGLALTGCGGSGSSDNATSTMQTYTNAVTELRASGYRVAQGNAFLFTNSDCPTFVAIFNSCFGNNSAAPYVVPQPPTEGSYVDPDYAAPLNTPGPNGQNTNIVYRLSDNDALITVVSFPPKGGLLRLPELCLYQCHQQLPGVQTAAGGGAPWQQPAQPLRAFCQHW